MRVTKIAGDFHDIGERPCRVWCNEVEIEGWTVADDFRRVVETPGKVHHGAVRIDLDGRKVEEPVEVAAPLPSNSLSGILVPEPKPVAPAVEAAEAKPEPAPAPTFAAPAVKAAPKHIPARRRKAGK